MAETRRVLSGSFPSAYPYLGTSFKATEKKKENGAICWRECGQPKVIIDASTRILNRGSKNRVLYVCWLVPLCLVQCCLDFLFLCSVLVCPYSVRVYKKLLALLPWRFFFFTFQHLIKLQRRSLSRSPPNATHSEFK